MTDVKLVLNFICYCLYGILLFRLADSRHLGYIKELFIKLSDRKTCFVLKQLFLCHHHWMYIYFFTEFLCKVAGFLLTICWI